MILKMLPGGYQLQHHIVFASLQSRLTYTEHELNTPASHHSALKFKDFAATLQVDGKGDVKLLAVRTPPAYLIPVETYLQLILRIWVYSNTLTLSYFMMHKAWNPME